ncbi:MAG: hypothetical protein M1840_002788 [Geoglossum simile]|nr:MAG: hypothetical protein M1840_002788 [Geoglossum simile]
MGTGPDRYKLNSKRPLDPLQLTPRKRLQQGEQADSGGPRIVTIVERLENLESNYSAQTAHIAGQTARIEELEKLVSALQEGIFGRAQNITRPREGECGPEGPRVGTSGATVVRLPSVPAPRSDGLAGGKRNSPIEVEDEDSEDGLYSASVLPTPPYTPALTTTQPPPPKLKMPHPICNLRAIHHTLQIPDPPNETFSYNFLQNLLGGHYISDGYHEIGKNSRPKFRSITSWYTLSLEREPYAPSAPGHHGAKLSVFMRQHNFVDHPPFSSKRPAGSMPTMGVIASRG